MASNVIDAFIMTLGLDPSDFKKGQKEAAASILETEKAGEKQAKVLEEQNKKVLDSVKKIKDEVLSLTAVLLGGYGIKEFISHVTESDAAVGRLAKNLDIASDELAAWEGVAQKFGGSKSDIDNAFRNISGIIQEYRNFGWSAALEPLQRAGVDISKFTDRALSNTQRMKLIQDALRKLPREEALDWARRSGFTEDTVNVLLNTGDALDKLLEKQKALNKVTNEQSESAERLEQKWHDLIETVTGTARKIWYELTPAIESALEHLQHFAEYAQEHLGLTATAVGALALAITGVVAIGALQWAAGWTGALSGIAAGAAALIPIVTGLSVALVGLATGVGAGYLFNLGWEHFSKGGSFGQWLYDITHAGDADLATGGSPGGSRTSAGSVGGGKAPAALFSGLEAKYGLPAGLLDSVWAQESGRGRAMLSPKGAKGHFGFMDATAREYHLRNPNDLEESADAAARKLRDVLAARHGNLDEALADYNGGGRAVAALRAGHPFAETRGYISGVEGRTGGGGNTTVNVGEVKVYTQANDADGIARDIGRSLEHEALATQANQGLR